MDGYRVRHGELLQVVLNATAIAHPSLDGRYKWLYTGSIPVLGVYVQLFSVEYTPASGGLMETREAADAWVAAELMARGFGCFVENRN